MAANIENAAGVVVFPVTVEDPVVGGIVPVDDSSGSWTDGIFVGVAGAVKVLSENTIIDIML